MRVGARRTSDARDETGVGDDRYWRGELGDDEVRIDFVGGDRRGDPDPHLERNARRSLRRTLTDLFGEPLGSVSADTANGAVIRRDPRAGRSTPLDTGRTAGCREEIQVTMLGHPVDVAERIVADALLDELRTSGVSVTNPRGRRVGARQREIAWDATVRTIPWRRRPATLRLFGSPSANVTVLSLTPVRSRRLGVRSFLAVGMRSLERVCQLTGPIDRRGGSTGAASVPSPT